jgi:1,4-dihydroxy-6-naphthoate synthase
MRRNTEAGLAQKVNRLIRKSVEFAFANPEGAMPYVRAHAQAMSEEVMKQHIALYVNDFSVDLGETGRNAVQLLFDKAKGVGIFDAGEMTLVIE